MSSESSAPQPHHLTMFRAGAASDIDFAPSTVAPLPNHPVPMSSDDGVTLDWTGSLSGDEKHERRWALPLSKRREKGKVPLNSVLLEKQELSYAGKPPIVEYTGSNILVLIC